MVGPGCCTDIEGQVPLWYVRGSERQAPEWQVQGAALTVKDKYPYGMSVAVKDKYPNGRSRRLYWSEGEASPRKVQGEVPSYTTDHRTSAIMSLAVKLS